MEIAIIGGGASALMCASFCNNNVTIFSNEEKLGKKILLTGNGRCNLTNVNYNKFCYNANIENYLQKFDCHKTIDFFNSIGLMTYVDEMGRVYPISNTATSVVEVFANHLSQKNIKVIESQVEKIEKLENGFLIDDKYHFDKVVIATGSEPKLLDCLNVKYNKFYPSLVALKTKQNTKRLSGLRLSNVEVRLQGFCEYGEVLFKDSGLSGICIFNLSSLLARQHNYEDTISIDLLPKIPKEKLEELLINRLKNNYKNMTTFMQGIFHKEINKYLLNICKINEEEKPNKDNIQKLVKNIKSLEFNIIGTYDNNQVKNGGVDLVDLTETLEYKGIEGLYFIGEICDVDGLCGGYNLQWAWTSGKIVGESLC